MNCRGDEDIDAKRSRPSIGKPVMGHARKKRVVLFGTDQRITSGPAAKRPHSKAEYMTAPERFADSQIPLAPRAPSIHGPQRRCSTVPGTAGYWGAAAAALPVLRRGRRPISITNPARHRAPLSGLPSDPHPKPATLGKRTSGHAAQPAGVRKQRASVTREGRRGPRDQAAAVGWWRAWRGETFQHCSRQRGAPPLLISAAKP
jgi:hypothetical protein